MSKKNTFSSKQILENTITEEKTTKQQYVSFWKENKIYGEFSQWFPSKFTDSEGTTYNNCEQYMMYQKALLFGDIETAKKVLRASTPAEMKKLGREVKYFDEKVWNERREEIVYDGNYLKFTQNPRLKTPDSNSAS